MGHVPARALAVAAACIGLAAGVAEAAGGVYVAAPRADAELVPVAAGYARWLASRLADMGLRAVYGGAAAPEGPDALRAQAAASGAAYGVAPDLRYRDGRAEIRLGWVGAAPDGPVAAVRAEGPLAAFGDACEQTAEALGQRLGLPPEAIGAGIPPQLDELAATTRALHHLEAGRLSRAWHEVEGRLSPTVMALREEIAALALEPSAPQVERARLLAATGDARSAWRLLSERIAEEERSPQPDPQVLVAAGEIQLAGGNPGAARRYFEGALRRDPNLADAHSGLAHALEEQGDAEGARAAFARAAELAPDDPRPMLRLAELDRARPERRAAWLVQAGRRSATRLDVERANRYLDRAARLAPHSASEGWRAAGELEQRLGRPRSAVAHYARAQQGGIGDVALFRNLGAAQRALGDDDAAEQSFRRALELDGEDPTALRGLAALHVERGRAAEGVALLERAGTDGPAQRRTLARALHAAGRSDEALDLLAHGSAALRDAAAIQTALGRPEQARATLVRALAEDPFDADLHAALAEAYAAGGNEAAAAQALESAALLGGVLESAAGTGGEASALAGSFEALVLSFAEEIGDSEKRTVVHLGLRSAPGWRQLAVQWLHPRALDLDLVDRALEATLARHFALSPLPPVPGDTFLAETVDRLYDFDSPSSLGAESIASVNDSFGSDAVFVGVATRGTGRAGHAGACGSSMDVFEIELRMLAGQQPEYAAILVNGACPADGLQGFGTWNVRAFTLYAALVILLMVPVLRGWGSVVVLVKVPPRTRGFFNLRIARRPAAVSKESKAKQRFAGLRRMFRSLSRYRRYMVTRETAFRWVPARREAYYVTLVGPLKDASGKEIIGHFLEEKRLRVKRGAVAKLEYDLTPQECALEVSVLLEGRPATQARAAVKGDPSSFRYAPEGSAFLYVGKGTHTVLMGAGDRASEARVEVRTLEHAIPVCVDLADPGGRLFEGCAAAVDPYLQSDFARAADLLEQAGCTEAAHRARGEHYRARGDAERAAAEFEAAGLLDEAADLQGGSGGEPSTSAQLYERAGDHERAAEAYRASGDLAAAGRAYEAAYDFDNALECFREVGDEDKVLELLERTGVYLEVAEIARRRGESERAIRNLQQIARNDSSWPDGCALLAELLAERGDHEIAVETFEEALQAAGGEMASPELQERYARLLEKCGEREKALRAWASVGKRDPARTDVTARISVLREELQKTPATGAVGPGTTTRPAESRYELIEELGRGGMGVVFKARDRRLGRMVALKQLPQNLRDHPEAVKLFLREARAAASLNHRNIVTLHDAGEENGSYFITMELLEGLPLDQILARRGVIQPKDVARIGVQVAAGLAYAQSKRVVHRDIKTGNLFFTRDRVVKIMDFGLAKTIEEVRKNSTVIGGTPYYMAPEQAAGEAVDHRADLYAFGVTLFRLATGDFPFPEGDLTHLHRTAPPPDPRAIRAEIPDVLAELILALMAKDPADRPASGTEVGQRLQQILAAAGGAPPG